MENHEIRAKLAKGYRGGRGISDAEWSYLKDERVLESYSRYDLVNDEKQWAEFVDIAHEKLNNLATYVRKITEQQPGSTERNETPVIKSDSTSTRDDPYVAEFEMNPAREKLFARAQALHLYDKAKANRDDVPFKPLLNAAGFLSGWSWGTPPDWIGVISTPLWVPAEEVKKVYEQLQKELLKRPRPPKKGKRTSIPSKTRERTYEKVRFVWDRERRSGQRLTWKQLTDEWNAVASEEDKTSSWRAFRKNVLDGEKSTLPKHVHEEARLKEILKDGRQLVAFDIWSSEIRRML